MTVPPHNGPSDPYGAPQGSTPYPQQQPSYPASPPDQYGQPQQYGQQGGYPQQGGDLQGYGPMPPAPAGGYGPNPAKRPGMVTAAAVLAFVVGGLSLLVGLVGISLLSGLSGFFAILFVLLLVLAAVEIWGGVQVLTGRDARILTIAAGVSILFNVISLINSFTASNLTGMIIPALILYFLLNPQSKAWFDRVGAKHF